MYDLPNTSKAWRSLILLQPVPKLQHWPQNSSTSNSVLNTILENELPLPKDEANHPLSTVKNVEIKKGSTSHSPPNPALSEVPPSKKPRFAPPLQPEDLKNLEKPVVPKKTKQATHWAIRVFNDWISERNSKTSSMFQCPSDLLVKPYPPAILDQWLAAFIIEVRKADGNHYTPDSLQCILAGVQRHLRENLGRNAPNIIDKKNDLFPLKRHALDQQLRFLRKNGIGVQKKRAPVITREVEDQLWASGTLGLDSPTSLLNAIFFLNGNKFVLRGVSEHYNLRFGSIHYSDNPDHIHYVEHGSKNNSGGLEEHNLTVKNVVINAVPRSTRCHVKVYREYLR